MISEKTLNAFLKLSDILENFYNNKMSSDEKYFNEINNAVISAEITNPWFTKENIFSAFKGVSFIINTSMEYLSKIEFHNNKKPKKIGVILAGNIPLVGFHDFFSVLVTGNIFIGKSSSKDEILLKSISDILIEIDPSLENKISFENKILTNFDAIIATGSNNSSRYFDYYFGKYPNIIRKNRSSIAVLDGNESENDLDNLSFDILSYFGLGCRNVSKVFVPLIYNIVDLMKYFDKYESCKNHSKYFNNYEYNRALFLINKISHFDNSFFIIKKDASLHSPISVLHYEFYKNQQDIENYVKIYSENIQTVVSNNKIYKKNIKFGNSQFPEFSDFADNVNTIEFLTNL